MEYAVCDDGEMPAKRFILALPPNSQSRLLAIFRHVAENKGEGVSPQQFKHERGRIWTFKCKCDKRRIRLPCFREGNRWIVTHGFFKLPKSTWPEQEFTLANGIMSQVLRRQGKNRS